MQKLNIFLKRHQILVRRRHTAGDAIDVYNLQ